MVVTFSVFNYLNESVCSINLATCRRQDVKWSKLCALYTYHSPTIHPNQHPITYDLWLWQVTQTWLQMNASVTLCLLVMCTVNNPDLYHLYEMIIYCTSVVFTACSSATKWPPNQLMQLKIIYEVLFCKAEDKYTN